MEKFEMAIVSANGGVLDMSFFVFGPLDPENTESYSTIDAQVDRLYLDNAYFFDGVDYDESTLFQGRFEYTYDGSDIVDVEGLISSIDYSYGETNYEGDSGVESFGLHSSISGLTVTVADYRAAHPEGIAAFLMSADDLVTGGNGDDIMFGFAGDDTIRGGAGRDWLDGGQGADIMVGGAGNDLYFVDSADDIVFEAAGGGIDTVVSTLSYVLGAALDRLTLVGANAMSGIGNTFNNTLNGNDGVSTLSGLSGDDSLFGGLGDDLLIGGVGADVLDGGSGIDTASYADAQGSVTVSLSNAAVNKGEAAGDTFDSIENIVGSAFGDYLNGSGMANVIERGPAAIR